MFLFGTFTASATQITTTTPASADDGNNLLKFYDNNKSNQNGVNLYWLRAYGGPDQLSANYIAQTFFTESSNPPGLALPDATTWIIASVASSPVPEPSTFITAALGGLGLIVHNSLRRRKSNAS